MHRVNSATILNFPERSLLDSPKQALVHMIVALRSELECLRTESTQIITDLQEKLALRDAELGKLTKANINNTVNQPSSKQPEFNKDTGVDPNKKKKRKKRGTCKIKKWE